MDAHPHQWQFHHPHQLRRAKYPHRRKTLRYALDPRNSPSLKIFSQEIRALLTLSFSRPLPCRFFQQHPRRFLLQLFLQRPHPVQVFSPDTAQSRKFAGSRDPVAHPVSLTAGPQTLVPASPDLRVCRSPASCAAPHLPGPRRVPSFRTSLPPDTASNPCGLPSRDGSAVCRAPAPTVSAGRFHRCSFGRCRYRKMCLSPIPLIQSAAPRWSLSYQCGSAICQTSELRGWTSEAAPSTPPCCPCSPRSFRRRPPYRFQPSSKFQSDP